MLIPTLSKPILRSGTRDDKQKFAEDQLSNGLSLSQRGVTMSGVEECQDACRDSSSSKEYFECLLNCSPFTLDFFHALSRQRRSFPIGRLL
jgi:hypothetical protein